ncbi:MAG: hypothetical protein OXG96_16690 [Acidobacteria bacterium]|nr:hypothetical protein [Acidobacteriota bacterium]
MLPVILKWLGTIAVLLLINFAVGARAQSEVQPAARSAKQPQVQSPEQSPAQSEEDSATEPEEESPEQSPAQSTTEAEKQPPAPSADRSGAEPEKQPTVQSAEQPQDRSPDQSGEPSPTRSEERSAAQPKAPPEKLPPADAYRLTVTIHGAFGLCNNDEFGSEELYVVVKRLDLDLQDRIDDIEREAQQITGRNTWRYAERHVDSLRKQDFDSKSDPLSEAELKSLEGLRGMKPTERTRDQDREFSLLRAREPISTADASVLARMRELESQRRRFLRRIQMRSSADKPGSLRVYPDDELQVVLMEDDPCFDDTCFGSTVLLDPSSLTTPSLEIKKDDNTLLTLNFRALSR